LFGFHSISIFFLFFVLSPPTRTDLVLPISFRPYFTPDSIVEDIKTKMVLRLLILLSSIAGLTRAYGKEFAVDSWNKISNCAHCLLLFSPLLCSEQAYYLSLDTQECPRPLRLAVNIATH
jgi:hypothetical protein